MNRAEINQKIRILDQHTANQIAAGEVVERPFSVIKELVENSIDAGATEISVRIFDPLLEKMQVSDNGSGMSKEELRLSVLRHATSKISSFADLDSLHTLGFRGEALPSIASVSQLTIISKQKPASHGYSLTVRDGKPSIPEAAAAGDGTTVLVDRLFYNAPARKKFLKTPRTEIGLISDLLARYIVAYPQISFSLINGEHTVLRSSGQGIARNALFEGYGKSIAEQMIAFEWGFISPPTLNRANRNYYNFFVNGRPARSRELSKAVDEAYFNFIPANRYPLVFIFLELLPETIDVNVHPSKLEIKFKDFTPLRQELIEQIRSALGKSQLSAPEIMLHRSPGQGSLSKGGAALAYPQSLIASSDRELAAAFQEGGSYQGAIGSDMAKYAELAAIAPLQPTVKESLPASAQRISQEQAAEPSTAEQMAVFEGRGKQKLVYAELMPLGQFAGTFIIAALGEYLYIIDQHAAAERILYEKIAAASTENLADSAQLALPIAVDVSYQESLQLIDAILELRDQGFIVEHFGENSFVIRGVPRWYSGNDPEQLLRLFLAELADAPANVVRIRKEELFMAACKQALKANRYLDPADISELFSELDKCENSATCPHGRPLAIKISRAEIYKRFLRGSI